MARTAVPATGRILDRLPPLATTGVGSLPFDRAAEAARHALGAYDLPFCPQLPGLDGDMVAEWLGADPGPCGWTPDRDRERPAAWHDLAARLTARPPAHGVVKLQVTGPVTLATAMERAAGKPGRGERVVTLAWDIAAWLAANASAQVRRLQALGLDALVVVDEPGLACAGLSPAHARVWDPLRAIAPTWGMHVCGPVPWRLVDAIDLDLISIDLAGHGLPSEATRPLERLLGRGGRVAWGVIDPLEPGSAADASGMAIAAIATLAREYLPVGRIAELSLLTPSCGTGPLSPERELLVAASLDAAAHAARGAVAALPVSQLRASRKMSM